MTQAQSAEEKARLKKQWTELAIQQALASQWEEAVVTNRNILNLFPTEAEAYNRLGKAYSELGQYTEARQAYTQTLKYSPNNTIAKKNLDRLALLQEEEVHTVAAAERIERIDPRLFIEETGKTGVTELINVAPSSVLAKVGVGDKVQLHVNGHTIYARNAAGEDIGQIEPRLSNRLINFMEGGNRYAAAILSMEPVRLIIREEYQHPSMFGKVSFPAQGGGETIRAYIKDSMLRYDREEEDELLNEDEYYDGTDETDDMTEIDFEGGIEGEE
ncbi:MAG TPA: tetratricopeptide repeat protein [Ktedonobacteraceae bacterium]|nr:tetratricopeptide repeat protein [Ktedonobacteraceae bacterium]